MAIVSVFMIVLCRLGWRVYMPRYAVSGTKIDLDDRVVKTLYRDGELDYISIR